MEKEIKDALKKKLLIIGANATVKKLKQGKIVKVFLASNCPESFKDELMHLGKLDNVPVIETEYDNEALGVLCRKQFKISTVGILKE